VVARPRRLRNLSRARRSHPRRSDPRLRSSPRHARRRPARAWNPCGVSRLSGATHGALLRARHRRRARARRGLGVRRRRAPLARARRVRQRSNDERRRTMNARSSRAPLFALALASAACLRVSEERARRDLEVGRAEAAFGTVEVEQGLSAVRRFEPGVLELWANAPVLHVRLTT